MKPLPCLLCASLAAVLPLTKYTTPSAIAETPASQSMTHHYATHFFEGHWSAMSLPSVTVKATDPTNPKTSLTVILPDTLTKITGQDQFHLTRQSGSAWSARQNGLSVTFSLISDNSAMLRIDGSGEKQHLNMFLYRDE
ncbi:MULTISPECIES: hypothetical protein [Acetobacter]|uniref:DUF3471 domain-containing protein n=1 Tax=Acetobacter thailandicus TaxID=1502842 RepID=A0ABT3QEB6_9PROT|nr:MULTISPECIES: hypothetical protein [Acetobacter]MBS0960650.1 hypothetical protein [Acetobacter thailandicus]MBS1004062.1 hypothetical protein [Acetobacter thailandicus]MCX2563600.1 hypothetical protein [Acetobacter thailandicus]NHN94352.1 hypothetical protein [Acetobacter thailandicus]OUI89248.1 hypothetical protein HK11_01455 [Acetobacter sp. DmW_043]